MLRLAILVGLLSACGGGTKGPAWPTPSSDGPDGGESLAPRVVSPLAANDKDDDDDDDDAAESKDDKPATKSTTVEDDDDKSTPKATSPTVTAPEDVINLDDLVIEIDD